MEQNSPAVGAPVEPTVRPLVEPVAWFRAPYGTLEPNPLFRVTGPQSLEWAVACFTEDQLRAAVAAERERRKPLTDAQIDDMRAEANRGYCIERDDYIKAVRDAERAHGIGA